MRGGVRARTCRYWHGTGFPFPLSITMVHMCLKWALTVLAMFVRSGCKRSSMPSVPLRVWLSMGVPVGMATALDIMLAQFALLFTTVTLTTVRHGAGLACFCTAAATHRALPFVLPDRAISGHHVQLPADCVPRPFPISL